MSIFRRLHKTATHHTAHGWLHTAALFLLAHESAQRRHALLCTPIHAHSGAFNCGI